MKSLLIAVLALTATTQVMAEQVRIQLGRDTKVLRKIVGQPGLHEHVTFRKGTRLLIKTNPNRQGMVRLLRVINKNQLQHPFRFEAATDINRDFRDWKSGNRPYARYFMNKQRVLRHATYLNRPNNPRPRPLPAPIPGPSVIYDDYSYQQCYQAPRRRYSVIVDQQRYNNGSGAAIIGGGAAILGQIIGGDGGNILSAIGVGFAAFGLIEMNAAQRHIFVPGTYNFNYCRRFYNRTQVRTVYVRQQQCKTTRYYTTGWYGRTSEYFQTTCRSGSFLSFSRGHGVW